MKAIHTATSQRKSWIKELYSFLREYRAVLHQSTGVSPSIVLNNREMNIAITPPSQSLAGVIKSRDMDNNKIDQRENATIS